MAIPTGEIVARPMIARACGCKQEFQHYAVDKYRAQRLAKFQKTRCADCVNKLIEEQRKAAAATPSKAEVVQSLPLGTQFTMTKQPDGKWKGTMTAEGKTVTATGDGPTGLAVALARLHSPVAAASAAAKPG